MRFEGQGRSSLSPDLR